MKPFLIKIAAFFLLLMGAMPLLFTISFLIRQQIIRYEMKERLEKEYLHVITVPEDQLIWVKYNKEIIIGDKLFDVNSFSEKDGLYFLVGLYDEEETALNDLLEKDTDDKKENEIAQLFQWLQSPCTSLSFEPGIIITHSKICSFPILLHISSPFINILTPPPQA